MTKAELIRLFTAERCSVAEIAAYLGMRPQNVVVCQRAGGYWPKHTSQARKRHVVLGKLLTGLVW